MCLVKHTKARSLIEAPFYLRAYFLHSAVEFAYLRCFNSFLTLKDLDLNEKRVNKEKRNYCVKRLKRHSGQLRSKSHGNLGCLS
jgi:hypothetical protein